MDLKTRAVSNDGDVNEDFTSTTTTTTTSSLLLLLIIIIIIITRIDPSCTIMLLDGFPAEILQDGEQHGALRGALPV